MAWQGGRVRRTGRFPSPTTPGDVMGTRHKGKQSFAGIPREVMRHPDFLGLNGSATKLLLELAFQFRGFNNGDLTTAFGVLKDRGWNSRATIDRAKKDLLATDLIRETRSGRFENPGGRCALYALTWLPINECPGRQLETQPSIVPPRSFKDSQ